MPAPAGIPSASAPKRPSAWRTRLQRWFWSRLPRRDSTVLQQRNLYILPTGAGWLLLATLLAIWLRWYCRLDMLKVEGATKLASAPPIWRSSWRAMASERPPGRPDICTDSC